MNFLKSILKPALYFLYFLGVFNYFILMVLPDFRLEGLLKWDIFMILLWAPFVYSLRDK